MIWLARVLDSTVSAGWPMISIYSARTTLYSRPKSFIEVTICTSSNILVWFGRDASEKGVAGLTESLISSPLAIAKGLVKYERPNSWTELGQKS